MQALSFRVGVAAGRALNVGACPESAPWAQCVVHSAGALTGGSPDCCGSGKQPSFYSGAASNRFFLLSIHPIPLYSIEWFAAHLHEVAQHLPGAGCGG